MKRHPKKSAHEVFIAKAIHTRKIRNQIREEIRKCVARLAERYPGREKIVWEALEGAYQALSSAAHQRAAVQGDRR
jgi:hypothetical protein